MGPFSEERQLKRRASVLQLLQSDNLSEWAKDYWKLVYNRLAMDEGRYNARVVSVYSKLQNSGDWCEQN